MTGPFTPGRDHFRSGRRPHALKGIFALVVVDFGPNMGFYSAMSYDKHSEAVPKNSICS